MSKFIQLEICFTEVGRNLGEKYLEPADRLRPKVVSHLYISKIPMAVSKESVGSQPLQRATMRIRPGRRMAIGT